MTRNLGILPINLGPAKLQKSQHTFVHYYELQPLFEEFQKLNDQYDRLKEIFDKNYMFAREFINYEKILTFHQKVIQTKIDNINHERKNKISKRGIVNGLGSIVKAVTGNLDSEDGEKIYNILNHMKTNQYNLVNQLSKQYSINNQVIKIFNDSLKDIEHNEILLKSKILQLSIAVKDGSEHIDILSGKEILNELLISYNVIRSTLQDIENSISFCRLNTFHPSIMTSSDLFLEIERVSAHYKNTLPFELNYDNILKFESVLNVNCKIEPSRITYFLSLPIDYEKIFELYYLLSIPTEHESEFLTIVPNSKFVLLSKSDNSMIPLFDICTFWNPLWHCASKLQGHHKTKCEEEIILHRNTSHCPSIKLEISDNHIEIIPEIDEYLIVFPKEEKLEISCDNRKEVKSFKGIFFIRKSPCKLMFRKQELTFQEKSFGKPEIMDIGEFKINEHKTPAMKIELKKLNMKNINMDPMIPIQQDQPYHYYMPSLWTVILYILLGCGIIYLLKKFKRNQRPSSNQNDEAGDVPLSTIKLPGGASF